MMIMKVSLTGDAFVQQIVERLLLGRQVRGVRCVRGVGGVVRGRRGGAVDARVGRAARGGLASAQVG